MKLTSLVLSNAPVVLNPEGQLTLQLRNLQIPYLENLGITEDKFRVIDLTNNELSEIDSIPLLKNLEVLLLAGNNIQEISPKNSELFQKHLPLLRSLSLINNKIRTLYNLKTLSKSNITDLALIGNPVEQLTNYRLFTIWLIPTLKILDFNKVKQSERIESEKQYGPRGEPNELAVFLLNGGNPQDGSKTAVETLNYETTSKNLTDEDRIELLRKLENAESIDEIEKIEGMLKA
ncbi:uncharacterized protein PRCAT00003330001 [Priceomyces carsonii]|uniref:uncharacterized protein n=1 Tax=Priceomyces carsonii TaxID=28549 RepID=UPI002EDA7C65|nr:unnamed protein product [Priceomyces carsonii]